MGNIQIPRIQRKTRDLTPKLTAKASPSELAAPFTQEVPKLARAIGGIGEAVGGVIKEQVTSLQKNLDEHKKKKREERVNNAYLETASKGEQLFQEVKTREAAEGTDLVTEYAAEFEKVIGEAVVQQGLDANAEAALRARLIPNRLMWRKGIAQQVIVDREVNAATFQGRLLEQNSGDLRVDPTPERLSFAIAQGEAVIDQGDGKEADKTKAKQLYRQSLTETYLDSIGPEEALASLDSRKLGYSQAFKDTKELTNFRNMLDRKAKAEKTRADNATKEEVERVQADTMISLSKGEPVDEMALYKNPAVKDDPKAIKDIQTIFKNYSKEVKAEQKQKEYADIMNNPNLVNMTNAEINSVVTSTDDAVKAIKWRDSVLNNSATHVTVNRSRIQLEDDYTAGKFGKLGSEEAQNEYTRQLRDYQAWVSDHPGEDAFEGYYKPLMTHINSKWYSDKLTVPDPEASRKAINFLRDNNAPITQDTVRKTVEYLKEKETKRIENAGQ